MISIFELYYKLKMLTLLKTVMIAYWILRLHRMHEMLTILIDVPGVCLSVCHAA